MSNTPRTDAAKFLILSSLQSGTEFVVKAEIAEDMECELTALKAELEDARSLAFNLLPNRTEDDALSDLCEQIDLLGQRLAEFEKDAKRYEKMKHLISLPGFCLHQGWHPNAYKQDVDAAVDALPDAAMNKDSFLPEADNASDLARPIADRPRDMFKAPK